MGRSTWLLLITAVHCNGKLLDDFPVADSGKPSSDANVHVANGSVCPDDGFGDAGRLVTNGPGPVAMQLQADGKIVSTDGMSVARYDADGTLDTTFGNNGVADTKASWTQDPVAMTLANGKIAISFGGELRQLDATGALDGTFGTQGVADAPPLGPFSIHDLAALPDGSIIAAGWVDGGVTGRDFLLLEYTPTGHLDSSFGTGGVVEQDLANGSTEGLDRIIVRPDGKIVVAGYGNFLVDAGSPIGKLVLARYTASGALDTTFGANGVVQSLDMYMFQSPSTYGLAVIGLARAPSDAIVVAFDVFDGDAGQPATIARFAANGSLDATFGSGGYVRPPIAMGLVVDPTGGVLVTNAVIVDGGTANQLVATRYDATGALDTTYGSSGSVFATFDNQMQVRPSAQRLTPTGALLVGGSAIPTDVDGGSAADYARFSCP